MKTSGDVTPPTTPVGFDDNKLVAVLNSVSKFVVDSVKMVNKIFITQIVKLVTTALFKDSVIKFTEEKLKVLLLTVSKGGSCHSIPL